ncbi:MAG: hypothetical protein WC650_04170 [Candidatus Doudnabacteria bacterium]
MTSDQQNTQKLKELLVSCSLDDLLRSFFVINLWLPNVASPIKIEYLYSALESVYKDLQKENKIKSYKDFESLCRSLFDLLPSFSMLEDYIPETDWGEIKYFFKDRFYKIFYGASLSNPYDFYYGFEIIHGGFEEDYSKIIHRSPLTELKFCLNLQHYIITNLDQTNQQKLEVRPGDISIPLEEFWGKANTFISNFLSGKEFDRGLFDNYSCDLARIEPRPWVTMEQFLNRAMDGKNCFYFFIKDGEKYYPVMPRKFLFVLYDTWGTILQQHYTEIKNEHKHPEGAIEVELFKFIRERSDEEETFGLVSPLRPDKKPHQITFAAAIRSKDKLFLIHVVPPFINKEGLNNYLKEIATDLKETELLLSNSPIRLMVWSREDIIEFHSKKEGVKLKPVFFTAIPYCTTEMFRLEVPEELPGEVLGIDQLAGIIDELKNPNELAEFLEYIEGLRFSFFMLPLTSYLDKFGSFRDSYSVIIPGASTPNALFLDLNWGTDFRFRSLSDFWKKFPEVNFFGHPRSWKFPEESQGKVLESRRFHGYAYHQTVGSAVFFVNSPIHLMSFEQCKITDLMMQSITDSLELYQEVLSKLNFANEKNRIQILFAPASLVKNKDELKHLEHLISQASMWQMDITRLKSRDFGIRVIFDDEKILHVLQDAKDRSAQVNLLLDVLHQTNIIWADSGLQKIEQKLSDEKSKKSRFKTFLAKKEVSFPETIRTISPEKKDFKLADKSVAQLANELNISPGKYTHDEAKIKLNQLIGKLVRKINSIVAEFSFERAIPLLLEKTDALIHEYEMKEYQVKESLDQDVDYERESSLSRGHQKFLHHHKNFRYLIEKFVQLSPKQEKELSISELKNLLALVDRLLNLYTASDILHYEIYPAELEINHDFIASVIYTVDVPRMEGDYGKEQAQINLGIIGNKNDIPDSRIPIESYLDELDEAFRKDFSFGLKNFINVQQVMSFWAGYQKIADSAYYSAEVEEIIKTCSENVRDFNPDETGKILEFLTLKSEDTLKVIGDVNSANDLPVWEYWKRAARYTIKPLLRVGEKYFWGPYSVERSARIWTGIFSSHRLPADLEALNVFTILKKGHEDIEESLVNKIVEVVKRFTNFCQPNVYFHKLDSSISDIGDSDVLAYLQDKNILLNIESKIIDPAYCLKDIQRIQRKIFGRNRRDGSFEEGYLQRVEGREIYIESKSRDIIKKLGWQQPGEPVRVISVFVTQLSFWWTKFPSVETKVRFMESKLLNDFIKNLPNSIRQDRKL